MSLKNWFYAVIVGLTLSLGATAKPIYNLQPPAPVVNSAITNEISGVWIPSNPTTAPNLIGLSLTVISGKYFVQSQWGLPDTCGNYLGLKASVPKSSPNTTIAGEREIFDTASPVNFGTEVLMRIPGRPGIATYVRIDSYNQSAQELIVTFSQNSFGFNGQINLVRSVQFYYPTPLGCHL